MAVTGFTPWEELPEPIKMLVTKKQWEWTSPTERERFIESELMPEEEDSP